jgi:hypothetical protein
MTLSSGTAVAKPLSSLFLTQGTFIMLRHSVLATAFLVASIVSANAGIITKQVDFSISGIGAVTPVTGSFTISLDPSLAYFDQTSGLVMHSLNLTVGSPVTFDYLPIGERLLIGGAQSGNNGITSGGYDFLIAFSQLFTTPQFVTMGYFQGGDQPSIGAFSSPGVVGQVSAKDVDVPEPVTLSLFGAGFAGLIAARRRRKKA